MAKNAYNMPMEAEKNNSQQTRSRPAFDNNDPDILRSVDRSEVERSHEYGRRAPHLLKFHLTRFYWWGWGISFLVSAFLIYQHVQGETVFFKNSVPMFAAALLVMSAGQIWFRKRAAFAHLEPEPREVYFWALAIVGSLLLVFVARNPVSLMYPILVTGNLARTRRRNGLIIYLVMVFTQAAILIWVWPPIEWLPLMFILSIQMQLMCLLYPANLIREWSIVDYLSRMNRDLESTRELLRTVSVAEENARIARDIHDASGHKLIAAKLQLDLLEEEKTLKGRHKRTETIRALLQDLMQDLREIVSRRNSKQNIDLADALATLVSVVPKGLCKLKMEPIGPMNPKQAQVLLRVAQEGLANALKHANAKTISICYSFESGMHILEIIDDGIGIKQSKIKTLKRGIWHMRRRVEVIDGRLTIGQTDSAGTLIRAEIPALEDIDAA